MKFIYGEMRSVLADIRLEKYHADKINKVISKVILTGEEAMILFSELDPREFERIHSHAMHPLEEIVKRLKGSQVYGIKIEVDCGRT